MHSKSYFVSNKVTKTRAAQLVTDDPFRDCVLQEGLPTLACLLYIATGGILGTHYIPVCTPYNAVVTISDALKVYSSQPATHASATSISRFGARWRRWWRWLLRGDHGRLQGERVIEELFIG